jgi:hypothetical protein
MMAAFQPDPVPISSTGHASLLCYPLISVD